MIQTGRPKQPLVLSMAERASLTQLVQRPSTPASLRLRAQIVLACADGRTNKDVAARLKVTAATVGKWRDRFVRQGLVGLGDGVRSGRPRRVDRASVIQTIDRDLSGALRPPSTRALAAWHQISQSTAARIARDARAEMRRVPGHAILEPPDWSRPHAPAPVPKLLADRVYATLRSWILSGELSPGDRVLESEIARALRTSQTPAHEAIRRLVHEGLVTYRPRQGTFVSVISQAQAREARDVRVVLETAAARRAAGRIPDSELQALRCQVSYLVEVAEHGDIGVFRRADMQFHRMVCAASGNAMLLHLWQVLESSLWSLQVISDAMFQGDRRRVAEQHGDLVDSLERADPDEAGRLFAAHAQGEDSRIRLHTKSARLSTRYSSRPRRGPAGTTENATSTAA